MAIDRSERRQRGAARRRHRRVIERSAVASATLIAVFVVVLVATMGASAPVVGTRAGAKQVTSARLHPPGPIPGYLLIADRGNNRMLLVDSRRRVYWRYPSGAETAMPFVYDDDTFFGPYHDRIISNQEDQHTIQIVSFPGGRVLWRYGHVNVKSGRAGYLNTPDDAYLLPSNRVTVADAYNCRVLFITLAHKIVRQYGTTGVCRHDPPRYLGAVNGATPLADGGTLISEIAGSWIDDIGPSGRLKWAVQAPVSYPSDPQLLAPNRILLADYANPGHAIIMTSTGHVLWRYGPASGPGKLDHPSLATRIAPGLIAINDDYRDRVVLVSIRQHRIVWQYGHTDRPGVGPGYLNTPDGLDLLRTRDAQQSRTLVRSLAAPIGPIVRRVSGQGLVVSAPYKLRAPVEREVAVVRNGAVILAGGLDSGGSSTNGVFRMNPSTGALTSLGAVPQAFHDAAGAIIGHDLFVFGGGAATSSASVQRFDLVTRTSRIVSSLPRALSDIAAVSTASGVYLVGGYDAHIPRREIYRTTDGIHFSLVGRLPIGLRYPAVAAVGASVVIAGGTSAAGASDQVYVLDTGTGNVRELGRLPAPAAHAQAMTLAGAVYIAGGVDAAGNITGAVTKIVPAARQIVAVPGTVAVSDAATVTLNGYALVIGGATSRGTTASVRRVRVG